MLNNRRVFVFADFRYLIAPRMIATWMIATWMIALSAIVTTGCTPPPPPPQRDILGDLATSPELIFDKKFGPENVTLEGVALGAHESSIPKDKIKETNEYGWRMLGSGARFLVKDGKVVKLALAGDLIKSLKIDSREMLFEKLGEPDESKKEAFGFQYHFEDRGIVADWIDVLDGLTIIRISKPSND